MIQIIDNEIIQIGLPKVGTMQDGSTVSGYNLLDSETLKAEGWLPIEDIKPEYDPATQILKDAGWDIQADKAVKLYEIADKPQSINPFGKIKELEETLKILLGDEE